MKKLLKNPERSLQRKVWVIIGLALLISLSAIGWSFYTFSQLTSSLNELNIPNEKEELITSTLQDFISAENHIQSYIITGNITSARTYEALIGKTRDNIVQLKTLSEGDSSQLQKIDTLQVLFEEKIHYLYRFLQLKKKRQAIAFTQLAREQIEATTSDSTIEEKEIRTLKKTEEGLLPIESEEIVTRKDTSKGFWNSVKRFFGNSYVLDTVKRVDYDYYSFEKVTRDTTTIKSYRPDSLLLQVKQILAETEGLEYRWQQNLTRRELDMIVQDQLFMKSIRSIMNELNKTEKAKASEARNEAFLLAQDSTKNIISVAVVGFIISSILLILITKDFTQTRYFRKQLEIAKADAEKLADVKGQFLANMSHEIRTPLNSLQGFIRLLQKTHLTENQRKYMNAVSGSSNYLSGLVNDILDYSKIESGKLTFSDKAFKVDDMIEDVSNLFSSLADEKGIEFISRKSETLINELRGDPFRIKQIIHNLVANAIKFTDQGNVSIVFDGNWFKEMFYLKIVVSDTGTGIAKERLSTIFEVFNQEEPEIANTYGGTGLGLAITKQLVQQMNGTIKVESEKGTGSTFQVTVPLKKVSKSQPHQTITNSLETTCTLVDMNIVIVEDDNWNAVLLETLLTQRKGKVHVFNDPGEAISFIRSNIESIDMVFTDLKMPKMSGQKLIAICREIGFKKPIVAITAHLRAMTKSEKDALGIQAICVKPYNEEELDQLLISLLPPCKYQLKSKAISKRTPLVKDPAVDIQSLKEFAKGDRKVMAQLTEELTINNEKQVDLFKDLMKKKSWEQLGELAHQMIPTYEQTQQLKISELLRTIELYSLTKNHKRMAEVASETVEKLESALEKLLEINDQLHTS